MAHLKGGFGHMILWKQIKDASTEYKKGLKSGFYLWFSSEQKWQATSQWNPAQSVIVILSSNIYSG